MPIFTPPAQPADQAPYLVYTAVVSKTAFDTDVPTAEILQNTLSGIPAWSYHDTGAYFVNLPAGFPAGKISDFQVGIFSQGLPGNPLSAGSYWTLIRHGDDAMALRTYESDGSNADVGFVDLFLEIRVYP